ncbi:chromosome partitioning protein ParB [Pelagivirga sediminicola]|uniref:Chromosome partitioning protein ParB n=1 Tax=Pelagivirga sediminicola TaxID=2170575 RepID=A0A2T7G3V7_9RHOB|nr:ParB N-terminal domain-containing protein [Pelagivirga sediminicola]PVA09087.1 chromosome partitioning protein ParB [Pelagivirga sediminicola]
MAKRKKLEAPSAADITKLEEEFRRETSTRSGLGAGVPIAQVAGEAAQQMEIVGAEIRAGQARIAADAQMLKDARAAGLLMAELPLEQIDADAMVRDRMDLDEDEMLELRQSIAASGLRLPIEVFELPSPGAGGVRFALVSGYRRYMAVRALRDLTGQAKYDQIRAIVRPLAEADAAFAAMVEENEVRAQLTPFERGRIAVISTQQGAFANVEDAVNRLYATASKSKRSKVRSFAVIFEELGDMLTFPEALSEKRGLRLAQAVRNGDGGALRDALARRIPDNPEQEWATVESVIAMSDDAPRDKTRGGRPARSGGAGWQNADVLETTSGITIRKIRDEKGYVLRLEGRLDADLMDSLMLEIKALLDAP